MKRRINVGYAINVNNWLKTKKVIREFPGYLYFIMLQVSFPEAKSIMSASQPSLIRCVAHLYWRIKSDKVCCQKGAKISVNKIIFSRYLCKAQVSTQRSWSSEPLVSTKNSYCVPRVTKKGTWIGSLKHRVKLHLNVQHYFRAWYFKQS